MPHTKYSMDPLMHVLQLLLLKAQRGTTFLVRKVKSKLSDFPLVTVGIGSISSWYQSWPRLQPSPHRKSFKARLSSQPRPWLQCVWTSWDRRHAGSPIRGINPRTNEQAWQGWKWKENREIRGIELFLSLSIICRSSAASDHRIHSPKVSVRTTDLNGSHYLQVNVHDMSKHDQC